MFRILLLSFSLITTTVLAQSSWQEIGKEVDAKMKAFKDRGNLSSVAYAIVKDGKIVHEYYNGLINQENPISASRQSVYRIASMSKSFAGMAILQLRDQGKLRLDDPITQYIPELKGQKFHPQSSEITIRHLLTHAAGFPEDNPWGDRQLGISTQEMVDMFKKGISFSNEPGVAYEYSNMGFAMLGYIIDQVAGESYQTYIQKHIWEPLGMKNTYWDYQKVPAQQLAWGYRFVKGQFVKQPIEKDGAYGIMGGILTSIEDFAKYMTLHQQAYEPQAPESKILKKSSIKEMHFPANFNAWTQRGFKGSGEPCDNLGFYGYGLRIDKNCENITMVGHSGGLPGFGSDWKILPQYGIGIVTLSNSTYGSAALMNNEILPFIVQKMGLKAQAFPTTPILNQRQKELMEVLPSWKGAEQKGIFAVNFFQDYYIDMLQTDTENVFKKIGKIVKVHAMEAENALRGKFLVEGSEGKAEISFTLSPENPPLIQAFNIKFKP